MPVPVSPWYENPLFLSPIFGFLGVIVGAVITAGSSYLLEKQREDRERRREQRIRTVNITTAARLIELDFRFASTYLRICLKNKRWATFLKQAPSFENWEKYCAFLAPEVSQQDWVALVVASRAVAQLANHFERAQARDDKGMSDAEAVHLAEVFGEAFENARDVLLQLAAGATIEAQTDSPEDSPG